jgi:hypothetical protein
MQTFIIDVINSKALKLLQALESLELIRVREEKNNFLSVNWEAKYKGTMTKQSLTDIDNQLNELRNEWE